MTAQTVGAAPPTSRGRIVAAGLVGNVMEWYDFAVYGYFASVIGKLFFPSEDPSVSLIAAFGAFAAGFLVRPLGGIVFGRIGDLAGFSRRTFATGRARPECGMGVMGRRRRHPARFADGVDGGGLSVCRGA